MDIQASAFPNASTDEDTRSSSIGLTPPNASPEAIPPPLGESSKTGVSTSNVHPPTRAPGNTTHHSSSPPPKHWYALRTTYGREKKAYDYIIQHGGTAFYPTITTEKLIKGKKRLVEVSRLPNIFFAYGTEEAIKSFVYDNRNLPFLRFYYKHTRNSSGIQRTPLIVPDRQLRSLQIICDAAVPHDTLILTEEIKKFQTGDHVRIIEGDFAGVEGIVARFRGQQRVGIIIDGLLTAVTAYIPSAFLIKK